MDPEKTIFHSPAPSRVSRSFFHGRHTRSRVRLEILSPSPGDLSATTGTANKTGATRDEEGLKQALLAALQQVQIRAKRKYKPDNAQRKKYFINANIEANRATLEEAVGNVLLTLATDTLPGLKPAHKTALQQALTDYKGIQTTQSSAQGDATGARGQFDAKLTEIADLRREVQYAADVAWPAGVPGNAGIRGEFQIPSDKALA